MHLDSALLQQDWCAACRARKRSILFRQLSGFDRFVAVFWDRREHACGLLSRRFVPVSGLQRSPGVRCCACDLCLIEKFRTIPYQCGVVCLISGISRCKDGVRTKTGRCMVDLLKRQDWTGLIGLSEKNLRTGYRKVNVRQAIFGIRQEDWLSLGVVPRENAGITQNC